MTTTWAMRGTDRRDDLLTWHEVLRHHRTLRGINAPVAGDADTPRSILVNAAPGAPYGDSGVADTFDYAGEGRAGDQTPTRGNRGLILAHERGYPVRMFEKRGPNRWRDHGDYLVGDYTDGYDPAERRRVIRFRLRRMEETR